MYIPHPLERFAPSTTSPDLKSVLDALAAEPGVDVQVTRDPDTAREADLLVLPGSRATVSDLAWLRRSGLADVVLERARRGAPVLGICGGYQMLLDEIVDDGVEGEGGEPPSGASVPGLGLLPGRVVFAADKVLARSDRGCRSTPQPTSQAAGSSTSPHAASTSSPASRAA